jgi:cell division control protein 7
MLHGAILESTIPTLGERGFTLDKIVLWSTGKWKRGPNGEDGKLWPGEASAVRLLERCLALDPAQRISAEEALQHEFLNASPETEEAEAEELDRMYTEREEQEEQELGQEQEQEEGEEEEEVEEEEEQEDV